jgi:hypothetical protein
MVLVIEYWNLDIVCYLLFGAWDFLSSWIHFNFDIPHNFSNIFAGQNTR